MVRRSSTSHLVLVALVALALLATACSDSADGADDTGPDASVAAASTDALVTALSTRADMVTGGDVLIEVAVDSVDAVESVEVDGGAVDVDLQPVDGAVRGLVSGLPEGDSTITVTADGETADLDVVNHSIAGPVFSGERLPMVTCTTERYGLAAATPPECDAEAVVRFAYLDAGGEQQDLAEGETPPADARSVTVGGEERPAVLRIETGVIDRGVYTITTLANGSSAGPATGGEGSWDADHWNGRLVYRFGGGCGTTYSQGFNFFGAPDLDLLADGYAFATNTLNTFQVQCQDIVSAEAAMMTKEHFAETYDVPEVTIGEGGSGGAIQQLLVAQNYPGILDAIAPALVFPDAVSISPGVVDCALLSDFYASPEGQGFTPEQRRAVNGHLSGLTCTLWEQTFVPVIDPSRCGFGDAAGGAVSALPGLEDGLPTVPEDEAYDAETNPDGLRCTFQDSYPQVFEPDAATGFAERPVDNTGVQYGLKALNAGTITPDQFIALNQGVGGFDLDANHIPERMDASAEALERLYATGRVVEGGPLLDVPIIATNVYTDPEGDIHDRIRMFSLNERLASDEGVQAPNYVMWTRPSAPEGDLLEQLSGSASVGASATRVLDEWATALAEDDSSDPVAEKMERARPAEAVNTCFDVEGQLVEAGPDVYDGPGPCTDPYPVGDDPRTAAGAPLANDIAKCQLQSVEDAVAGGVYEVEFTDEQVTGLESVFPDGVCDWTQPGIGQVPLDDPWQTFD